MIQLAYRRRLQRWQERGSRIDQERIERENRGSRLFLIPSPARRESRNWVFETVPLRAATVEHEISEQGE